MFAANISQQDIVLHEKENVEKQQNPRRLQSGLIIREDNFKEEYRTSA